MSTEAKMSTEAIGDGKPSTVDEVEQVAAASESSSTNASSGDDEPSGRTYSGGAAQSGAVREADSADEARENDETSEPDEDGEDSEAHAGDEAYANDEDDGAYADDAHGEDDEDLAPYELDDAYEPYEDDADETADLIERAEPVEFDEPVDPLRPARRWPRVLLAFGFVIAAAAIVGGAIAIVGSVTHGFKKPVKITYKTSAVFKLKTGDCFDPQGQSYTLIPCDSPHVAEVFATFPLAGGTWPGDAAVSAKANSGCASMLGSYLNPQLAISLASTYVYPDATAWKAGARTVICEVRASSGDLTGSVRGASATAS
jgi:Septum formation